MKRHLAAALAAVLCVLAWTGVASAADVLTLCINPGGNVKAAVTCKQNETEFKVVSEADFNALEARVDALEALLAGVSRPDAGTLLFTGMNLQVVNGSGATDGLPNSLGNIIIGYNDDVDVDTRTGSHNLVIGDGHTYTSTSGVVSGFNNTLTGFLSFVGGGQENTASAQGSFTGGGAVNNASGERSFVGGGHLNTASGFQSFVGGGVHNIASGFRSFVGGGEDGTASGSISLVAGGSNNTAGGGLSFVGGGNLNAASGNHSFVGGGEENTASGFQSFVGGGHENIASGDYSFVGGGFSNAAGPGTCGFVIFTLFGIC